VAITTTTGALGVGTDESTLQSISNNATYNGSEVDLLGDNSSAGDVEVYAAITSTVTAGTIDVTLNRRRVSSQSYKQLSVTRSVAPTNGTQLLYLGCFRATRYWQTDVKNNATGASASVSVLYRLTKMS
jgi:hypothetical protein